MQAIPAPSPGHCSAPGCGAKLNRDNASGRCPKHRYIPLADRPVCGADGCDEPLRKDNRTGYCTPHKRAKSRGETRKQDFSSRVYKDRTCPDCGDGFTPASANSERCPDCQHKHRLALRAEREGRNDRDTCSVDGCGAKLRTSNTTGRCSPHRYVPVTSPVCPVDGCGKPLRKDNDTGFCKAHKYSSSREQARPCGAPGCDRTLRTDNTTGYCPDHAERPGRTPEYRAKKRAVYHAKPKPPDVRRTCSADGCERKIRSDNTTGRCTDHAYVHMDWAVCSVDGCEARIRPDNRLGRCMEHRSLYWGGDPPKCGEPGCGRDLYRDNLTGFCQEHRPRDYMDAYNRAYYERNAAALREYAREYREVYAEEHREYTRTWNAANPEARQAMHARRRSRVDAGMDEIDRLLSTFYRIAIRNDPCCYCGSPVTDHVDHYFPLAKGGSDKFFNLVRACQRCNLRKQVMCGTAFLLLTGG